MSSSTPFLHIRPAKINTSQGETFTITLSVQSEGATIAASDLWIAYDPDVLQPILPVKTAGTFPDIVFHIEQPGVLFVSLLQKYASESIATPADVAHVTFRTLKAGEATIGVTCDTQTRFTSQIISSEKGEAKNIIDCPKTIAQQSHVRISSHTQVLGAYQQNEPFSYTTLIIALIVLITTTFLIRAYFKKAYVQDVATNLKKDL